MSGNGDREITAAILGAHSVIAQELRRQLEENHFPVSKISLYERADREGRLTEFEGEAMVVSRAEMELFAGTDLSFICGEDDSRSAQYLSWVEEGEDSALDPVGASRQTAFDLLPLAVQGEEGAEGTMAFIEKRLPSWAQKEE